MVAKLECLKTFMLRPIPAVATSEVVLHASTVMLGAQQAQPVDIAKGFQRQFQEAAQGVGAGMEGAVKVGTQQGLV